VVSKIRIVSGGWIPLIITLGCISVGKAEINKNWITRIEKNFAGRKVLSSADLDEDTLSYFQGLKSKSLPGLICGQYVDEKHTSCIALLVDRKAATEGVRIIAFFKDISRPSEFEVVEDYSKEKRKMTNIVLIPMPKSTLENRGDGPNKISMPRDGVQRIAYGQSAMVIYWDGKLMKVWTAD
jgi:hypothetical protein